VKHEITPVISGHRLVLTYNLISSNPRETTPVSFAVQKEQLSRAIGNWKEKFEQNARDCPKVLVYILNHLYTKSSLSYAQLKGGDNAIGQCLDEVCAKYNFLFLLAQVEHEETGRCWGESNEESEWEEMYWRARNNQEPEIHTIHDPEEEWTDLKNIVNLEGKQALERAALDPSQIVQEDPFSDQADKEDFSGPTGNEGVTATHYYHRSVS
jgi:hypothetical protein